MSSHPVLTDPDLSAPFDLIRFDGSRIETRGIMSFLDEGSGAVRAGYSTKGRQAWVSVDSPLEGDPIEYLRDADGNRFRVLAVTDLLGAWRSARLQLQYEATAAEATAAEATAAEATAAEAPVPIDKREAVRGRLPNLPPGAEPKIPQSDKRSNTA